MKKLINVNKIYNNQIQRFDVYILVSSLKNNQTCLQKTLLKPIINPKVTVSNTDSRYVFRVFIIIISVLLQS